MGGRRFRGLSRAGIVELKAADANRIDLYLQPIVTPAQGRYYEALSRLRTEEGDVIPAVTSTPPKASA